MVCFQKFTLKLFNVFFLLAFTTFFFTNNLSAKVDEETRAMGVNKFAWYATLQIINFMPLVSADPISGVIITDWYTVNLNTRYKMNVYILDGSLSSQTVMLSLFKQVKTPQGWQDTSVSKSVATKIEDSILNVARELKIKSSIGANS